jgi:hypothetical protein
LRLFFLSSLFVNKTRAGICPVVERSFKIAKLWN